MRHPFSLSTRLARVAAISTTLCGSGLLLSTELAAAQIAPTILEIWVFEEATENPVAGAEVLLPGGQKSLTNEEGMVRLVDVPTAPLLVEVRHFGYAPQRFTVTSARWKTTIVSVPLAAAPVAVPELRADAAGADGPRSAQLQEFYRRTTRGTGYYLTRTEIDKIHPQRMIDLLRMVPGLTLTPTASGDRPSASARHWFSYGLGGRPEECPLQVFIDGTPFDIVGNTLLSFDLPPDEIEGIEYYRGALGIPAQFRRTNKNCGLLLIWKRERM